MKIRNHKANLSGAILVCLFCSAPVAAQNLLSNPGFDFNLDGWRQSATGHSWSPMDAAGLASSGSARMSFPEPFGSRNQSLDQCFSASEGESFTFSADVFVETSTGPSDETFIFLAFFSSGDCTGSGLLATPRSQQSGTPGLWGLQSMSANAPPGTGSVLATLRAETVSEGRWDAHFDNATLTSGSVFGCIPSDTVLCLADERFQVEATWRRPNGETGIARVQGLTGETGYLWFFNPDNVEVIVKVKDACASTFNRFWVFASGLTNVEVSLRVTDMLTGMEWTRVTPLSQPFPPILDTDAFDTCPTLGEPPAPP